MKKLFLSLFVVTGLLFATSCSSSDDGDGGGNGNQANELTITIDGTEKTFDTVVLSDTEWGREITATIGTQTNEIINITANAGELGASVIWEFFYTIGARSYSFGVISGTGIPESYLNSTVTENSDSEFTASFSGVLVAYDAENDEYITVQISNGAIHKDF